MSPCRSPRILGARPPLAPAKALAWSYTRHRMLRDCERSVFWHYYGCPGQGLAPGDRSAPLAWALRHLLTVPLLVGTVVHTAAQRIARAVVAGVEPPNLDASVDAGRHTLNQAWRTSQPCRVDGWWEHPSHYQALQEILERAHLAPWEITRARTRLHRCLEALLSAPLWDDLRAADLGAVWLPPAGPTSFAPLVGVTAWGAIDAAYQHLECATPQAPCVEPWAGSAYAEPLLDAERAYGPRAVVSESTTWTIVDFKTAARANLEAEALQLGCYALWLEITGRPMTDGMFLGRIVDLVAREDRWVELTASVRDATRAVIAADVATLAGLMLDTALAIPRPKEEWKLASDQRRCSACRFHRLCTPELDQVPSDSDEDPEDDLLDVSAHANQAMTMTFVT